MTDTISPALEKLRNALDTPDPWSGSRFEWFKNLSGTEAGKMGERLAREVLGGRLVGRDTGYDLQVPSGRRVEVKLCRKSHSRSNVWSWKQIRKADEYDDLCLIAVCPNTARLFLVPRDQIPARALSNNHGRGGDGSSSQIAHPREILPDWILRYQVE